MSVLSLTGILDLFQGIATLVAEEPSVALMRVFLIGVGFLFIYLGKRGVLEGLLRLPIDWGMAARPIFPNF